LTVALEQAEPLLSRCRQGQARSAAFRIPPGRANMCIGHARDILPRKTLSRARFYLSSDSILSRKVASFRTHPYLLPPVQRKAKSGNGGYIFRARPHVFFPDCPGRSGKQKRQFDRIRQPAPCGPPIL